MDPTKMFGCGVGRKAFEEKFFTLPENIKQIIQRVADRSWVTVLLRYDASINPNIFTFTGGNYGKWVIDDFEMPSIEVFMLFSCLDTLAGQPNHKQFDEWLKSQTIVDKLAKEEILSLYSSYKKEYGTGANLKNLFVNLPAATKNWLLKNVKIYKFDIHPNQSIKLNEQSLSSLLFRYFYYYWRNKYAHGSISFQTYIANDIYNPTDNDLWVTPASGSLFILDSDKPNQEWMFSFRQGIDESTILRMIINSVVLQKIGIPVTDAVIEAQLYNLSRMHIFRAFFYESIINSNHLKSLSLIDDKRNTELKNYIYHVGIPLLVDIAAKKSEFRYLNNPLENGLKQMTIQYLREISSINEKIIEFNNQYPKEKHNPEHWKMIEKFLNYLFTNPSFLNLQKWPDKVEMTNLWIMISDPCYL